MAKKEALALTSKIIGKLTPPESRFDLYPDLVEGFLGVRVFAGGKRSYVALTTKSYRNKKTGYKTTAPDHLHLGAWGDKDARKAGEAISLSEARRLAEAAHLLFLEHGDKDEVARHLFARTDGRIAKRAVKAAGSETLESRKDAYFEYNLTKEEKPWKPETLRLNTGTWKNHIFPALGEKTPVDDITTEDVDALLADLSKGASVQKRICAELLQFRHWNEHRRTPVNYAFPKVTVNAPPKKKLNGTEAMNLLEIRAMGKWAWRVVQNPENYTTKVRRMARAHLLCMYTGLRIGSVLQLNDDSVMADENDVPVYLHCPSPIMKGSNPPNFSVPASRGLIRVLREMEEDENGRWFRAHDRSNFGDYQKRVSAEVGVNATFHGWRHTLSTWCGNIGIDQVTIEIALAHRLAGATKSSTSDRYNHSDDWRRTKKLWKKYSDFLDFVIHADAPINRQGEYTLKLEQAFKKWRKAGSRTLRVA